MFNNTQSINGLIENRRRRGEKTVDCGLTRDDYEDCFFTDEKP